MWGQLPCGCFNHSKDKLFPPLKPHTEILLSAKFLLVAKVFDVNVTQIQETYRKSPPPFLNNLENKHFGVHWRLHTHQRAAFLSFIFNLNKMVTALLGNEQEKAVKECGGVLVFVLHSFNKR